MEELELLRSFSFGFQLPKDSRNLLTNLDELSPDFGLKLQQQWGLIITLVADCLDLSISLTLQIDKVGHVEVIPNPQLLPWSIMCYFLFLISYALPLSLLDFSKSLGECWWGGCCRKEDAIASWKRNLAAGVGIFHIQWDLYVISDTNFSLCCCKVCNEICHFKFQNWRRDAKVKKSPKVEILLLFWMITYSRLSHWRCSPLHLLHIHVWLAGGSSGGLSQPASSWKSRSLWFQVSQIGGEMQKFQESKQEILLLFKWSLRPSQLWWWNLEWCLYSEHVVHPHRNTWCMSIWFSFRCPIVLQDLLYATPR
jgi:hypothetical protein